jgi:DNA-binding transcriptional ArsR family regulator
MNYELREELDLLHAQVCSALSDSKRIMILYLLDEGPKTVTQLMNEMKLPQPSISRNLPARRPKFALLIK